MAYQTIFRAASVAADRGVKTIGKTGMTLGRGVYKYRRPLTQGLVVNPARGAYKAGRMVFSRAGLRLLGPAFVGYEVAQGKNLGEGIVRGGIEATSMVGAMAGAKAGATIGAGIGSFVPVVGTAIGMTVGTVVGGIGGYLGVNRALQLGYGKKEAPFEQVYGNRRALTMRQAGMMAISRTKRPIGNEASAMHLR